MNETKQVQELDKYYDNGDVARHVWLILTQIFAVCSGLASLIFTFKKWKRAQWAGIWYSSRDRLRLHYERLNPEELGEIENRENTVEIQLENKTYHLKKREKAHVESDDI